MPRVLYGVSPIGLGHATRTQVVAGEIRKSGADVGLFSGGKAADFLGSGGEKVYRLLSEQGPHISKGRMDRVTLWYVRSWLSLRRTTPRVEALARELAPNVIVGDEEFSGMQVAERLKLKRVLIADELELGFARSVVSRRIESRVAKWYKRLQESVDLLIIPEVGEDVGNRRYVGPIVRPRNLRSDEVRRRHGIPDGRFILVSLSGSGVGSHLIEAVSGALPRPELSDVTLVVTGNRGAAVKTNRVKDLGLVEDNQNLVASADLVVSTAGKSTIDEAASFGTPIITIPIQGHAEQERNAAALGYSCADLGRLPELIVQKIGRREAPRDFRGGSEASRLILSLV